MEYISSWAMEPSGSWSMAAGWLGLGIGRAQERERLVWAEFVCSGAGGDSR
jgi:hypothetical protein